MIKRKNNLTGYENTYGYGDVHNLTSAKVEGTFVQEWPGTKLVATGDFKAQKSMQAVSDDLYQVSFVAEVSIVKVEMKVWKIGSISTERQKDHRGQREYWRK